MNMRSAGIEPRLKMKYGSYVAAPRWARTLLHLAGTLGYAFGALLGWIAMPFHLTSRVTSACRVLGGDAPQRGPADCGAGGDPSYLRIRYDSEQRRCSRPRDTRSHQAH
jgi:hypothetical protein